MVDTPGAGRCQVALAVTRRSGNAVVRNRIRRRLRAGLAELDVRGGLAEVAVVVTGDGRAADLPFPHLVHHLERALVRARAA